MIKIITALANPILNERLKEEKEIKVIGNDIFYQEGILEILEKEKSIDYIIMSELLEGKLEIKKLLEKIIEKNQEIKIILFLQEKNKEKENEFYRNGIYQIYYHNQIEVKEIIQQIKNENKNQEKEEVKILKEKNKILEEEIKLLKENEIINAEKIKDKKIISILGTGGVGKSIITINLANVLKEKIGKVLIIDFDILNNSLHTILGVTQYPEKIKKKIEKNNFMKINIKELIIKINKKIDLISGLNLIFDRNYKISSKKINDILEELKKEYSYIIIDTSAECFFEYTKEIMENSDICLFLTEANLVEIKKAKNWLNIYTNEWKIEKNKIHILINKYQEDGIADNILKNIFSGYNIIGKIKLNKKYNLLINTNYQKKYFDENIKKEYEIISKKIIQLKSHSIKNKIRNWIGIKSRVVK